MADPISALAAVGAVSSVLQIVDFSGKVLYNAARMTASDDALRENIEIERLTRQHEILIQEVAGSEAWNPASQAQAAPLIQRAIEISQKAGELLKLLDDLKVTEVRKGFKRAYQSTRQAARAVSKRAKVERKQEELQSLTKQLEIAMLQNIGEKQHDGLALLRDIAQKQTNEQTFDRDALRTATERLLRAAERLDAMYSQDMQDIVTTMQEHQDRGQVRGAAERLDSMDDIVKIKQEHQDRGRCFVR